MATRIPINKDNFDDRNKKIWEDMEHDMERRRREWEGEIDKMRSDFFHLRPEKSGVGGPHHPGINFDGLDGGHHLAMAPHPHPPNMPVVDAGNDGKPVIEKDERGMPVFKVRFNMKDYRPEEVNVKMDSSKIMVSAKHQEKSSGSTVSREYNREVNVPVEVDPLALQCLFQPDGMLVFTAPLPAPKYDAIKDASSASGPSSIHSPQPASSVKSSSSYHSSSSSGGNKMNGNNDGMGISHSPQSISHHIHHPQQHHPQHHQQPKVLHVSQQHVAAPSPPSYPSSSSNTTSSSSSSKFTNEHPDIIVPTFRAPPDINKLLDTPATIPPPLHGSPLPKPPPFTNLSTTFPAGPIFPDATKQIQLSNPTVTSHDGKFQLTMPIDDFKPEELTVKTQDKKVIICAKREVLSGSRNHTMEMNREHSLPDNVDPLTVKAFFTDTNMLIVEAPFLRG